MDDAELDSALAFFKALADRSRLRILGLLAERPLSVEELAAALELRTPTVSHHLATLRRLGLVAMAAEWTTHRYALEIGRLDELRRDLLRPERVRSLAAEDAGEAWQRKVLRDFFAGEELREIPASRKKRAVVLGWLAGRFAADRTYTEAEVGEVLRRHHPDVATLRRELVASGLMQRRDGRYWRPADPAGLPGPDA